MVVLGIVNMLLLMATFLATLIKPRTITGPTTSTSATRREGQPGTTERTVNSVTAALHTAMPRPGREFVFTQLSKTTQKG